MLSILTNSDIFQHIALVNVINNSFLLNLRDNTKYLFTTYLCNPILISMFPNLFTGQAFIPTYLLSKYMFLFPYIHKEKANKFSSSMYFQKTIFVTVIHIKNKTLDCKTIVKMTKKGFEMFSFQLFIKNSY